MIQKMQQAFLAQSASAADALHQAQALLYARVQQQAAALSFIDAFWTLAVLFIAMVPLVLLMHKPNHGAAPPPAH
jgi:hypothetical protein